MTKDELIKSYNDGSSIEKIDKTILNSKWEYIQYPEWNWERYEYRIKLTNKIHFRDFNYDFFNVYKGIYTNIGYVTSLAEFEENDMITTIEDSILYPWWVKDTYPIIAPLPFDININAIYRDNFQELCKVSNVYENFQHEMNSTDIIFFSIPKQSIFVY